MRLLRALAVGLVLSLAGPAWAQQILIDRGARVEGLWCFPSVENEDHWYYVPLTARLATDARGQPIFSFLRYVVNAPSGEGASQGITQAEGGGIVTLMATYDTPDAALRKAEAALRQKTERDETVLRGPVIFTGGRYVLVSSILREDGEQETRALATGSAPVFEGNEVAFSFDVTPEQSKLLLESFQMDTPDVSLVFEMTLTGLRDAYDARLTVNWEEVSKSEKFKAGGAAFAGMLAGDLENTFDELRRTGAIELEVRGENPKMQELLDAVHGRLLAMMFKKKTPEEQEQQQEVDEKASNPMGGMMDGLGGILDVVKNPRQAAEGLTPLSVTVEYEVKEIRKSGKTTVHFNNQAPVDRQVTMVANVGDLYARFGDDENRFRTVNLSDPAYQQREIHVGIDGAILPEFDKYINSVTVTLRKQHENGAQTLQEIVVDRNTFNRDSRDFRMIYGWNEDSDRDAWLQYDYRTRWSFKGGGLFETDWVRSETNMIDLYAPYRRNTVELIGDEEVLREQGVRAVSVHVEYDFFDGRRSQDLALQTHEEIDGREIEITLPLSVFEYDYEVTWMRRGKAPLVESGRDDTGVIFVDDIPEAAPGSGG